MKRTHAFLLSALLSLVVTSAFLVYANRARIPTARAMAAPSSAATVLADPADYFLAQERALQETIAEMQTKLALMETDYANKVQDAQAPITLGQQAVKITEESIASSQAEIEVMSAIISQDAQNYEQQLAVLQANEAELRQNLDATLATLDTAQSDLTMQQAAGAGSVDNGGGDHSDYDDDDEHEDDDEYEEHDDDEHEDDDDDDD